MSQEVTIGNNLTYPIEQKYKSHDKAIPPSNYIPNHPTFV